MPSPASPAFQVRAARADDVPAVLPMVRAICDLHQQRDPERFAVRPDVLERYASWLPERAQDPRSVFLVAQREGTLVAFTVCTIEPEVPIFWVPECGWIHDLYVIPEARRLGIAHTLVGEVIARFTTLGVKQLRLHTASFNDQARASFSKAGFRPCVVEMLRMV